MPVFADTTDMGSRCCKSMSYSADNYDISKVGAIVSAVAHHMPKCSYLAKSVFGTVQRCLKTIFKVSFWFPLKWSTVRQEINLKQELGTGAAPPELSEAEKEFIARFHRKGTPPGQQAGGGKGWVVRLNLSLVLSRNRVFILPLFFLISDLSAWK